MVFVVKINFTSIMNGTFQYLIWRKVQNISRIEYHYNEHMYYRINNIQWWRDMSQQKAIFSSNFR